MAKAKAKVTAKAKSRGKRRAPTADYNDSADDNEDYEPDVDFLTADPKSPFANMDLIAEYSSPEFRALLTDQDKIEISELLPDHISLTEEGYFHEEFVRYDMDFRHAIRMYQQDLAAGRYDPEWLRQAAEAMEQRANGDFDKWKDQEFEEFWGQKQKLDSKARAGLSGTIKLNRLVEAGLFKEGDIFSYMRTFGRGKGKITVEKDVKIIEIDGTSVTFAIPPGQLKYARRLASDEANSTKPRRDKNDEFNAANGEIEDMISEKGPTEGTSVEDTNIEDHVVADTKTVGTTPTAAMIEDINNADKEHGEDEAGLLNPKLSNGDDEAETIAAEDLNGSHGANQITASTVGEVNGSHGADKTTKATAEEFNGSHELCTEAVNLDKPSSPTSSSSQLSDIPPDVDDVIIARITTLQALENKIVSTDGRLGKTVDGNAFKNIRVKRDNQDIGSLFEIREDWYTYKK